jgi:hypothetical protein
MKAADLIGADLDAWVARAEGRKHIAILLLDVSDEPEPAFACFADGRRYDPSTNPTLGQPIMERERIGAVWGGAPDVCSALVPGRGAGRGSLIEGPTMLVAGMRARVAQVYGDDVTNVPTGRPCPWPDPLGAPLFEGDTIQHPDGLRAVVVFDPRREDVAQWRAVYEGGESLFLGHQLTGRGQACKVIPGIQIVNPLAGPGRHPPRKVKTP